MAAQVSVTGQLTIKLKTCFWQYGFDNYTKLWKY